MAETLDIQKVIKTNTASVPLDVLSKKGFKQVRVLNQTNITRLIGEAVDRVLFDRTKKIGKEERVKVIKEARDQFESLARERVEKERGRIGELEATHKTLSAELDTLRKRLAAMVEVQAERDQAYACVKVLEGEVARLKSSTVEAQAEVEQSRVGAQRFQAEADSLRDAVTESEKRATFLEGNLAAKTEELEEIKGSVGEVNAVGDKNVEKLLQTVNERLDQIAQPTDVNKIMLSLDGISRRMASLSGGGGRAGEGGKDLSADFAINCLSDAEDKGGFESNIKNVKVKQAKAKHVKGALAKLKQMQKGVTDGE